MVKRMILPQLTLALALASPALAGQPERETRKQEEPKVKQAMDDGKKACGCAPEIKVDWDSYKSSSDMGSISSAAEGVSQALKELCTDGDNKKAICKGLKSTTITIHFKTGSEFEDKGKTVVCGTDGSSFCSSGQFRQIFEKW
jgi:hypothetical protein